MSKELGRVIGVVAAIISLTVLELVALSHGTNGTIFTLVVAAVSGLGGFELRNILTKANGRKKLHGESRQER